MKFTNNDLDLWIQNNLNVLFVGEAGVGKTARVVSAFDRNNLKWKYYSASTMDPWVDLIGIPKEIKNEDGVSELCLVKPKEWANDEVEAVFFDEFNRAKPAVRNAVMELIQFKSINGVKFNNLKIIWAAINPENSENPNNHYDVDPLDPAQKDRFHIHIDVPYECDFEYFKSKYSEVGVVATEWWNALSKQAKWLISPRRLDYIANAYESGLDISHFLPKDIKSTELKDKLKKASFESTLRKLMSLSKDEISEYINSGKNFAYLNQIIHKPEVFQKVFGLLRVEYQKSLYFDNKSVKKYLLENPKLAHPELTTWIENELEAKKLQEEKEIELKQNIYSSISKDSLEALFLSEINRFESLTATGPDKIKEYAKGMVFNPYILFASLDKSNFELKSKFSVMYLEKYVGQLASLLCDHPKICSKYLLKSKYERQRANTHSHYYNRTIYSFSFEDYSDFDRSVSVRQCLSFLVCLDSFLRIKNGTDTVKFFGKDICKSDGKRNTRIVNIFNNLHNSSIPADIGKDLILQVPENVVSFDKAIKEYLDRIYDTSYCANEEERTLAESFKNKILEVNNLVQNTKEAKKKKTNRPPISIDEITDDEITDDEVADTYVHQWDPLAEIDKEYDWQIND